MDEIRWLLADIRLPNNKSNILVLSNYSIDINGKAVGKPRTFIFNYIFPLVHYNKEVFKKI